MYRPALGSGEECISGRGWGVWSGEEEGGSDGGVCCSSTYMADVRPVRQPWSTCVAHHSSSSSFEFLFECVPSFEEGDEGK